MYLDIFPFYELEWMSEAPAYIGVTFLSLHSDHVTRFCIAPVLSMQLKTRILHTNSNWTLLGSILDSAQCILMKSKQKAAYSQGRLIWVPSEEHIEVQLKKFSQDAQA